MAKKTTFESLKNLHLFNGSEKTEEVLRNILWSIETGKTDMNRVDVEYDPINEYEKVDEWYGEYKTSKGKIWGITIRKETLPCRKQGVSYLKVETTNKCESYTGPFAAKAVSMMLRNERVNKKMVLDSSMELDEDDE